MFVSAGVTACMAPIFGPPVGTPQSAHLRKAALAILETQWRTPYHYDLFQGDVGHTLVLGATGAGKSFSLNFLLVQALQYDPRILILDLGGSYRWLTQFLGGGYMELSPASGRRRRLPATPLLSTGRRADLPIPDRLDFPVATDRRMELERFRSERDPRPRGRPLRFRATGADPWNTGPLLALKDVAPAGPLAR